MHSSQENQQGPAFPHVKERQKSWSSPSFDSSGFKFDDDPAVHIGPPKNWNSNQGSQRPAFSGIRGNQRSWTTSSDPSDTEIQPRHEANERGGFRRGAQRRGSWSSQRGRDSSGNGDASGHTSRGRGRGEGRSTRSRGGRWGGRGSSPGSFGRGQQSQEGRAEGVGAASGAWKRETSADLPSLYSEIELDESSEAGAFVDVYFPFSRQRFMESLIRNNPVFSECEYECMPDVNKVRLHGQNLTEAKQVLERIQESMVQIEAPKISLRFAHYLRKPPGIKNFVELCKSESIVCRLIVEDHVAYVLGKREGDAKRMVRILEEGYTSKTMKITGDLSNQLRTRLQEQHPLTLISPSWRGGNVEFEGLSAEDVNACMNACEGAISGEEPMETEAIRPKDSDDIELEPPIWKLLQKHGRDKLKDAITKAT